MLGGDCRVEDLGLRASWIVGSTASCSLLLVLVCRRSRIADKTARLSPNIGYSHSCANENDSRAPKKIR